jgi:hypothetical protein
MTAPKTNRRRLAGYAAMIVLALVVLRVPVVQNVVAGALIEFIEITERTVRFPCWFPDHQSCFTLDRLDPTCPHCL